MGATYRSGSASMLMSHGEDCFRAVYAELSPSESGEVAARMVVTSVSQVRILAAVRARLRVRTRYIIITIENLKQLLVVYVLQVGLEPASTTPSPSPVRSWHDTLV